MTWHKAAWRKGLETITGSWHYNWAADRFSISLDSVDEVTGCQRKFLVAGEAPEFNGWELIRKDVEISQPAPSKRRKKKRAK